MSDPKTEIRAAFEKEQAAFPPAPGLRRQLVDAVMATPEPIVHREQPNLQWLAVAAAVLVTVAIVAGLMAIRFSQRPTPVRDYGPPPAGENLLYVRDPKHASWLIGYDWEGRARATLKLPAPADPEVASISMSPDGGAFKYLPGNGMIYLDRLGRPIAPGTLPTVSWTASEMWADDNRRLCFERFDTPSGEWRLFTKLPGEADHFVGVVAINHDIAGFGVTVASCSVRNDLTILVGKTNEWPSDVWVIRLSNSKLLSHHRYVEGTVGSVVASVDGTYLGESSGNSGNTSGLGVEVGSTVVRKVSDWAVLSTLLIEYRILGFSGDGTLVLISVQPTGEANPAHLLLQEWTSGTTKWRYAGPETLGTFLARPNGPEFALGLKTPTRFVPPTGCKAPNPCPIVAVQDPLNDVVIIDGEGSTTPIPGRYVTTW